MKIKNGKFIVIEGIDGVGKATQTKLLIEKLKIINPKLKIISFPQYNTKSAGPIEEYLSGKYGEAKRVSPYQASIFYAIDRFDASFKIRKWINEKSIVVSDRYVGSNMAHQGGKIKNQSERKKYFNWLYNLEYKIFNIPKPDINIILDAPAKIAQKLSQQRTEKDWKGKNNDIHQNNLKHLEQARKIYLEIAENFSNFILIKCYKNKKLLNKQEIANLIWEKIYEI